jgi:fimbrial chaperone protein
MRHSLNCAFVIGILIATTLTASAGALRVSPVVLDLPIPAAAGSIRLQNAGEGQVAVQARIMRWTQVNGTDRLLPTKDVAISPPIFEMKPNATQVVRIVRTSRSPRVAEESYRILIDEIPNGEPTSSGVRLAVRHSIPVFFAAPGSRAGRLQWSIERIDGKWYCVVTNEGDRRVRISGLEIKPSGRAASSFGAGLVGYVLGRSSMRWPIPDNAFRVTARELVSVSALTDNGPSNAAAHVSVPR